MFREKTWHKYRLSHSAFLRDLGKYDINFNQFHSSKLFISLTVIPNNWNEYIMFGNNIKTCKKFHPENICVPSMVTVGFFYIRRKENCLMMTYMQEACPKWNLPEFPGNLQRLKKLAHTNVYYCV